MHFDPVTHSLPHHPFPTPYTSEDRFVRSDPPTTSTIPMDEDDTASTADSAIVSGVPRNPSDAWQDLTNVAKRGADDAKLESPADRYYMESDALARDNGMSNGASSAYRSECGLKSYPPVKEGRLNRETVSHLVARYHKHYHPYLPLVPRKYFDPATLDSFASTEKHLFAAVMAIASKDLVDTPMVHDVCCQYMRELILNISTGIDCDVEAVEAMLLLAEWEPQGLLPRIPNVGRGEEDRAVWMHLGIALRSGYYLGLDRTSFRGDPTGDAQTYSRKRLAWASCYVADRLISVRIGRGFWSRGPGPMTGLVSRDFPSLQPLTPEDEDYAQLFQAKLDLTQLYGNVHEVLYSGMRTSSQMMLNGDYVKYVDDYRLSIARWHSSWGTLTCKSHQPPTRAVFYLLRKDR